MQSLIWVIETIIRDPCLTLSEKSHEILKNIYERNYEFRLPRDIVQYIATYLPLKREVGNLRLTCKAFSAIDIEKLTFPEIQVGCSYRYSRHAHIPYRVCGSVVAHVDGLCQTHARAKYGTCGKTLKTDELMKVINVESYRYNFGIHYHRYNEGKMSSRDYDRCKSTEIRVLKKNTSYGPPYFTRR